LKTSPVFSQAIIISIVILSPGIVWSQELPTIPQTPSQEEFDELLPPLPDLQPLDPLRIPSGLDQTLIDPNLVIKLEDIRISGNTIFSDEEIKDAVQDFIGRSLNPSELSELENTITKLYSDAGYATSGAFIDQAGPIDPERAIIEIQVVEGAIAELDIQGAGRLTRYVKRRLRPLLKEPYQEEETLERLRLLLNDEQIDNLSANLVQRPILGESTLRVDIDPAKEIQASLLLNNGRSPAIGSFERGVVVQHINVTGWGDTAQIQLRNTEGSTTVAYSHEFPVTSSATVNFEALVGDSKIVEEPFDEFNLTSNTQILSLSVRQLLYQNASQRAIQEFAIGLGAYHLRSADEFDGVPVSISEGANPQGKTRSTQLRFFQDYLDRRRSGTLYLRSEFAFGLGIGDNDPAFGNGSFLRWEGQGIYLRRIKRWLATVSRINVQLSDRDLIGNEQFVLGGVDSVRGFRSNGIARNNGLSASTEIRFTVFDDQKQRLEIGPFFDVGFAWNGSRQLLETRQTIGSVGLGVRYTLGDRIQAILEYGQPIIGSRESRDADTSRLSAGLQVNF
jgi:hemolysin activation/secretion protein